MTGWLKLHRRIVDNPVFGSQILLKIWVWLQCKASSQDRTVTLKVGNGLSVVSLQVGQLVFGRRSAERDLCIDESTIYKAMQKLQELGEIRIDSNNKFSIVTCLKYVEDQQGETIEDFEILEDVTTEKPRKNHKLTTEEPQSNHSVTQLKKVKKVKKVENLKNDFSPPPSGAKNNKKNDPPPREHWQPFVNTWHNFYVEKHAGEAPTIVGKALRDLGKIYDMLQLRAKRKNQEWTEKYLVEAFAYFLGLAWGEDWLQKHFLLTNLVEQFDAVFARAVNAKAATKVKTFDEQINYILGRYEEGELDERLLTPDIYARLEDKKLIPFNYREQFTAATPDLQKAEAIKKWLETNKRKTA